MAIKLVCPCASVFFLSTPTYSSYNYNFQLYKWSLIHSTTCKSTLTLTGNDTTEFKLKLPTHDTTSFFNCHLPLLCKSAVTAPTGCRHCRPSDSSDSWQRWQLTTDRSPFTGQFATKRLHRQQYCFTCFFVAEQCASCQLDGVNFIRDWLFFVFLWCS